MEHKARLTSALLAIKKLQGDLDAVERSRREPIAIVGMACRFPGGAIDPGAFWRLLSEGVDAVTEVPPDRWDADAWYGPGAEGKICTREGAFVGPLDRFDPAFFGISPREAATLDPQQRLLLEVAWEALERAGIAPDALSGSKTGVFVGVGLDDFAQLALRTGDVRSLDVYSGTGAGLCFTAGRISFVLGLEGPSMAVDTACSSSLLAVHLACQSLRQRECSLALAGGVNVLLSPEISVYLSQSQALSPRGRCRTFDAGADGYVRGEGCGVVALKRLSDALADGDDIVALVRGSAVGHDGASSGLTVPRGPAQQSVIRAALENAGLDPARIGYVEAHGTGTSLGDPVEVEALAAALCQGRAEEQPLRIGAVKTNIGHLETAAGIAGLMKVALSLQHEALPANLHLEKPNPLIPWAELPVTVVTEQTPWPRCKEPRAAGVSAFGLSGTNVHVVLEEAPPRQEAANREEAATAERPFHLLPLSARSERALRDLAGRYDRHLGAHPEQHLKDATFTAGVGRAHMVHRAAIVARDVREARGRLSALSEDAPSAGLVTGHAAYGRRPRVAFLFTGQGAQYAGMGRALYATEPTFRRVIDQCATRLGPHLPEGLVAVMHDAEAGRWALNETGWTQPALFALEVALCEVWRDWGITPYAVMGHSVGELAAACVAGVFSLEDGLRLVADRGRLMQALPRGGAMAAVFAPEPVVAEAVRRSGDAVAIAAVNGPSEVVISGAEAEIEGVLALLEAAGVKARRLAVSHAFHAPQMSPMLDAFEATAAQVTYAAPQIRLVSNVTGAVATPDEVTSPAYWRRHVRETVRFLDGIRALAALGIDAFVEIGPKPTLLGAGRQCLPESEAAWLPSLREGEADLQQMLSSLGALYTRGAEIDWARLHRGAGRRRIPLPTYPFERERHWVQVPTRRGPDAAAGSPWLGRAFSSPAVAEHFYERAISVAALPFLGDHRIYGGVVVPGASHVAMMLCAAAEQLGRGPCVLEDVAFVQPLRLGDTEERSLQIAWRPEGEGAASCRMWSRGSGPGETWLLHAESRLRAAESEAVPRPGAPRLGAPDGEGWHELDPEDFYRSVAARGIDLGPTFRWIRRIARRGGEAWGELVAPEGLDEGAPLHPTLLDACIQLFGASWPAERFDEVAYVPMGIERLRFRGGAVMPTRLRARAVLRPGSGEGKDRLVGDVVLADDAGHFVAELSGLHAKRAPVEIFSTRTRGNDVLYEIAWPEAKRHDRVALVEAPGRFVILADRVGIGAQLGALLEQRGASMVLVSADDDVTDAARLDALLADTMQSGAALAGVVSLRALDAPPADQLDAAALEAAGALSLGGALHVAQALARAESRARLVLVTRGAQPVAPGRVEVAQAPLWGLGAVIALEHPEWRSTLIDLDPTASVAASAETLLEEILGSDGEDRLAFRGGARHVARLVRADARRHGTDRETDTPSQLRIQSRGSLEGLGWVPIERRVPGRGEVEIRVRATGLNFRDVLTTLGMYPGEGGPLGLECAGEVVRVGDGVEGLRPGDEVVALVAGSFSTFATVAAAFVAPLPPSMRFEEAATLPIAFLTAEYALNRLARMKRGERVLIHAAAGGVGLAAVQLAQQAGVEIFATAGSPEKHRYLASLGVQHTMSSRSADFVDEVMARTGGAGVDIVLNSLTGEMIPKSLSVLAKDGRFVEIGKAGIWSASEVAALRSDVAYSVFLLDENAAERPAEVAEAFQALVRGAEKGDVRPLPARAFPRAEAAEAFRYMAQARHIGKIVVTQVAEVRSDATYLVTGGLGSLGLSAASWLVTLGARHVVLMGRRGPSDTALQAVRALEEAGAEVRVVNGDVARAEDVARVLGEIDTSMPALRGVLHLAGTLDDGVVRTLRWDRVAEVLAPKVKGAWNLHAATRDRQLDLFVLFSSTASMLGSPGQASYSAANAFLDALAHHRHADGRPALSINWGAWADGGMAAGVDPERLRARGIDLIPRDEAIAWLDHLVRSDAAQVGVLPVRWDVFAQGGSRPLLSGLIRPPARPSGVGADIPAGPSFLERVREAAPSRRQGLVTAAIEEQVARVLRLRGPVEPQQPLREIGLDSLMAVELRNAIGRGTGLTPPMTLLFDYPTIDALTGYVLRQLDAPTANGATVRGPERTTTSTEVRSMLGEPLDLPAEELSDSEAEALLVEELERLNY
ncbi:type I polyketide synthase [Chondromyces crocatus]|uniref:Polyketide synthase n=1 Tax=Chondromyces crocatus TaxID=52 RepID=B1GYF5_CHOCO|nr:type I polyketide synthase [Chondromyces crocatus]AKT41309.1 polyketide synthase [Chondromyces crocatus]CAQ18828.1 polyketide synthase [Chondromyces crocatus]